MMALGDDLAQATHFVGLADAGDWISPTSRFRPLARLGFVRTLLNGWTTEHRSAQNRVGCIFGCAAQPEDPETGDTLRHYLWCPRMIAALAAASGGRIQGVATAWGLAPHPIDPRPLATAYSFYHKAWSHALRRSLSAERQGTLAAEVVVQLWA